MMDWSGRRLSKNGERGIRVVRVTLVLDLSILFLDNENLVSWRFSGFS